MLACLLQPGAQSFSSPPQCFIPLAGVVWLFAAPEVPVVPQTASRARGTSETCSCLSSQCSCLIPQNGQCQRPCPQSWQPRPSQSCPAQPKPSCYSLPTPWPPRLRYLYMVSASTSPNQTLRCVWKYSPCTSSMATSPPPVSCDGQSTQQRVTWCHEPDSFSRRMLCPRVPSPPQRSRPRHSHSTPNPGEAERRRKGSGAGATLEAGDGEVGVARSWHCAYLQGSDERHGADGLTDAGQALAEGVLHCFGANDCPAGTVVQQLPVGFLRAGRRLRRVSQLQTHCRGPGPGCLASAPQCLGSSKPLLRSLGNGGHDAFTKSSVMMFPPKQASWKQMALQ